MYYCRKRTGILPSDSVAIEQRNILREQRESEYQDYIKRRNQNKKIIVDIRSELSHEREAELGQNQPSRVQLKKNATGSNYATLRDSRLIEERKYSGDPCNRAELIPMGHQGGEDADKDDDHQYNLFKQYSTWDEEERGVRQWARDKADRHPRKAKTPPCFDSPHLNVPDSRASLRSISAPIAAPVMPLPGWNVVDVDAQNMKKLKYAEDLRRQMMEKQSSKNRTEHTDQSSFLHHIGTGVDRSNVAVIRRHDCIGLKHGSVQNPPPKLGRANPNKRRDDSKHDYPSYNLPPPPPRFHGHLGGPWNAPMCPYPVYRMEHDREARPEMYNYPYYYPFPHGYPSPHNYPLPPPPPGVVMPPTHDQHGSHLHVPSEELHDHSLGYQGRSRGTYSPPPPVTHETNEPFWRKSRDRGPILDKLTYREELEKQMKEKNEREMREKIAKESLDKKKDTEIYDPFGKGGCGAPVRDQHGNLVADLKQLRKINENRLSNNSPKLGNSAVGNDLDKSTSSPEKTSPHTILTYSKRDDDDVKKFAQDEYRDFLRQQVKEKEELKRKEKERQKVEEQKELEQLERDRKRLKDEYQQELERQRIKDEESRKKNAAIYLEAERERQRVFKQREQETRQEEAERMMLAEKELEVKLTSPRVYLSHIRSSSPPIPTLRNKMNAKSTAYTQPRGNLVPSKSPLPASNQSPTPSDPNKQNVENMRVTIRTSSPPVPALRNKKAKVSNAKLETSKVTHLHPHPSSDASQGLVSTDKSGARKLTYTINQPKPMVSDAVSQNYPGKQLTALDSEEILTKLGAIRMYLQEELARQDCESQSNIFERAKSYRSKIAEPSKSKGSATMQALEDFKHSKEQEEFLEVFPEAPRSDSTFAMQRRAMLRHQQGLRGQTLERRKRPTYPKDLVDPLPSQVAHVSLDYPRHPFSNDDSLSLTNTHDAVNRSELPSMSGYKGKQGTSHSTLSSVDSYLVDSMAARNEERIKRLEAILTSGTYSNPRPLDARGNHKEEGERRLAHQFPHGIRTAIQRRTSGQSERSLECETKHLPA